MEEMTMDEVMVNLTGVDNDTSLFNFRQGPIMRSLFLMMGQIDELQEMINVAWKHDAFEEELILILMKKHPGIKHPKDCS